MSRKSDCEEGQKSPDCEGEGSVKKIRKILSSQVKRPEGRPARIWDGGECQR